MMYAMTRHQSEVMSCLERITKFHGMESYGGGVGWDYSHTVSYDVECAVCTLCVSVYSTACCAMQAIQYSYHGIARVQLYRVQQCTEFPGKATKCRVVQSHETYQVFVLT